MKTKMKAGLLMIIVTTALACNRIESNNLAGKGGTAVLSCIPKHHDIFKNIINGKIFIAYNASDIPERYDDSASCLLIEGKPTATFPGLKPGVYYLLGTGYDTSISQNVKGGLSYTINQETSLEITVPVTETH